MPLAKCLRCNTLFNKVQSKVCPACQPAEDADFDKIRRVLEEESGLNAEEVSARAEVDVAVVQRMLEEGVITSASLSAPATCGRCGAPAISVAKRLCQSCLDKLNAEVAQAQRNIRMGVKKPPAPGLGNVHETLDEKRRI